MKSKQQEAVSVTESRLITEFMSIKAYEQVCDSPAYCDRYYSMVGNPSLSGVPGIYNTRFNTAEACMDHFLAHALYSQSWDWLMPVARSITLLKHPRRLEVMERVILRDLPGAYTAVIEFIKYWRDPESVIIVHNRAEFPYWPAPKGKIRFGEAT